MLCNSRKSIKTKNEKKIKVYRTSLEKYSAGTIWLENFMYLRLSGKKYLEIVMLFYSVGINVELTYSYCSWLSRQVIIELSPSS